MKLPPEFVKIDEQYLHGWRAKREGVEVEVLRESEGEWSVYVTRNGKMAREGPDQVSFSEACRAAVQLWRR